MKTVDRAYYWEIKESICETLEAYVNTGRPTGGFMEAVLSNDLMDAVGRADEGNRATFVLICQLVYNFVPIGARGSREAYREWRDLRGIEGIERAPTTDQVPA